ncbi:MAG: ABC transporter permease [Bacteroidaceae bacterium]|nr:ABC transporter permease [Bacteroidaceae bacterium]
MLWRLLRHHLSIPQLVAFFLANLLGMFIVLLSIQFYRDVRPLFVQDDGFLHAQYLVVHKRVTGLNALGMGTDATFRPDEIADLERQPFAQSVGIFEAARYGVRASLQLKGMAGISTEMFFESVPDRYVDAKLDDWKFDPASPVIPIILPRSYLALYNFGFAQTKSLPKLSEGLISLLQIDMTLRGAGQETTYKARIVGFSSRLNTILVPESFMQWSNDRFGGDRKAAPSRLIVEVKNTVDEAIASYMDAKDYELENDNLEASRAMYMLRVVLGIVLAVGLLICLLSFYILMLSIYLLVQKNSEKLHNLLLIGYSPARVSRPYQMLTLGVNVAVLLFTLALLWLVRGSYLRLLWEMFPQMSAAPMWPAVLLGLALLLTITLINTAVIRRRITQLWKN